jgi:hypothetical protein
MPVIAAAAVATAPGKASYYRGHKQMGRRCCGARACGLRLAALLGLVLLIVLWALLVGSTGVAMLSGDFCQVSLDFNFNCEHVCLVARSGTVKHTTLTACECIWYCAAWHCSDHQPSYASVLC